MKMVKSLLLGILPEETQMKPIKGISPGGGTGGYHDPFHGVTKETGNITGTEEGG